MAVSKPKPVPPSAETPTVDPDQYEGWTEVLARPDYFMAWYSVGQRVFGVVEKVRTGHDYNDVECPEWIVRLAEPTRTMVGDDVEECPIGSLVAVTGGQASLHTAMREAEVKARDLVLVTFASTYPTQHKQEGKAFTIKVARARHEQQQRLIPEGEEPF